MTFPIWKSVCGFPCAPGRPLRRIVNGSGDDQGFNRDLTIGHRQDGGSLAMLRRILLLVSFFILVLPVFGQTTPPRGTGNKPAAVKKPAGTPPGQAAKNDPVNQKPKRKIIVVLEFDDASLGSESQKRPMGRQISILLSNEFARRGNFTVIERLSIDKVLEDQNRSYNGRYDSTQASKIGKVFSATTVVLGTITEYSTRKKSVGVGGVFGQSTYLAKVGLAIRLVDVNTGEVQDSVTVEGTADEKSMATVGYGKATELNEELKTSLFTAATNQAISKGVDQLEKLIDKSAQGVTGPTGASSLQPGTSPAGQGAAASNQGGSSTQKSEESGEKKGFFSSINPFGKKDKGKDKDNKTSSAGGAPVAPAPAPGPASPPIKVVNVSEGKVYLRNAFPTVKIGDQLVIFRITKTITDDETGEVLGTETQEVGRIEILEIQEKMIIGKIVSGAVVQKNDLVRLAK